MNTDRGFRRLVFLAAFMAIATYAVADESIAIAIIALTLAVLGWRVTEKRGDRAVPRAVIALAITIAIGWAIVSGLANGLNVAQFCEFTIAVLVIKSFDRRTSADLGQFIMLSLFLAIGSILTSNTLWMALMLAPTLALSVGAGVAYQFHLGRTAGKRGGGLGDAPGRVPRIAGLQRTIVAGWVVAVAISMFVFLMFPRGLGADAFGQWGNPGVGMRTGFSNQVNLGEGGLISTSSVPVLDLTVRAPDGTALGASQETFYLRGAVLDSYRDGSWRASTTADPTQTLPAGVNLSVMSGAGIQTAPARARGPQVVLEVMVRNAKSEDFYVFTVWRPRRIEFETRSQVRFNQTTGVIRRGGQGGRLNYKVVCDPLENALAIPRGAQRTPASFESDAIHNLAVSIARGANLDPDPATRPIQDDGALASAIERYFDTGFGYTLDIARPPPGRDPIEWFLLEHKEGHCEYYASAMVALCRSVGINARVVTGYVATEFNETTRHYIVRESNAHAWVEVEVVPPLFEERSNGMDGTVRAPLAAAQWQTRDPTPSGEFRRIHRPSPTLASRLRDVFEAINYAWITSVVAFDDETRTSIVSGMRLDTASIDAWAEEAGRRIRFGGSALFARALENAMIAATSTAALGMALVLGGPMLRRRFVPWMRGMWIRLFERRASERAGRLAEAGFYARLLRALARRGAAKPRWRPPLDHARSLDEDGLTEPASRVVDALYRVKYGRQSLSEDDLAKVESDLLAVERPRSAG